MIPREKNSHIAFGASDASLNRSTNGGSPGPV